MATLARFQAMALDDAGNVLTLPTVEVRLESTSALASLFSDRAGASAIGNPFTGAADGLIAFHVVGGAYKVTITKSSVSRILRYVAIGTNAEVDNIYDGAVGPIIPLNDDGAPLGSPTKQWSDLYLANGGVISWNAGDVVVTHSSNLLTISGGAVAARLDPRLQSAASGDISPDISATDYYVRTALSAACAINAPTGTPVPGNRLIFRLKDNGTARALTFNAIYRAIATAIPTTTVINKTTYVACLYNSTDTKWDVVAVNTEA